MWRWACAAIALLAASAAAWPGLGYGLGCPKGYTRSGFSGACVAPTAAPAASFAFATASGVGMTAACACGSVTGTTGEVITFARASDGWCTKGNDSASIANGDLVKCGSGLPRVMPGGSGAAPLGVLMEVSRTNDTLYSEEIDNGAWTALANVAGLVITANAATAPDGTMTADRLEIPATTTLQYSSITQVASCVAGNTPVTVYVKGNGTTGVIDIYTGYQNCSYNPTTWTRCKQEGINAGAAILFGNLSALSGIANTAQDVFVWGFQCESSGGAFVGNATSYIQTTSTPVTRAADSASTPFTSPGTKVSFSASIAVLSTGLNNVFLTWRKDVSNQFILSVPTTTIARSNLIVAGGSNTTSTAGGTIVAGTRYSIAGYYDLADRAVCIDGACTTAAATLVLPTGAGTLWIGSNSSGALQPSGVMKNVCVNSDATTCR